MTRTLLLMTALALATTTALLLAGPLNPPAGPITGGYKTKCSPLRACRRVMILSRQPCQCVRKVFGERIAILGIAEPYLGLECQRRQPFVRFCRANAEVRKVAYNARRNPNQIGN